MHDWLSHPENPTEETLSQRLQRYVGLVWGVVVEAVARADLPGLVSAAESIGWAVWAKPSSEPELADDRFAARLVVGVQIASAHLWDRTKLTDSIIDAAIARFAAVDRSALLADRPWLEPARAAEPRAWMVAHNWAELIIGSRIRDDDLPWICVPEPEDEDEDYEAMDPELAAHQLRVEVDACLPGSKRHRLEDYDSAIYGLCVAKLGGPGGIVEVPLDAATRERWRAAYLAAPGYLQPLEMWLCERTGHYH